MIRLAALLVAIGLWFAPLRSASDAAANLRSDEGAYRMRLCELALFTGESAQQDRLLQWGEGQEVPYGAFAPAASAFLLSRLLPNDAFDVERGELDETVLAAGAQRLQLVLAWIAALAIAFATTKFSALQAPPWRASPWIRIGALAAPILWTVLALAPSVDGGSVRESAWGLILCSLVLGGAALLARPRELADLVGLAIGVGLLSGLALANDLYAWPTVLAPLIALGVRARATGAAEVRNAVRAGVFFVATAVIVSALRTPWPQSAVPWPVFEPPWPAHALSSADMAIDVLCIGLVGWLVWGGPASTPRRTLALTLVLSFALRLIDARFALAPLAPAGCALALCAESLWQGGVRKPLKRALCVAVGALMLLAAALNDGAPYSVDSILALRELREATPSSGAWNHPLAQHDYAILANPRAAGAIVFHARRPVCAALLPGASASDAAREAAGALLCDSIEALAARAKSLHAAYVIVARRDLEEASDLLALAGQSSAAEDQERVRTGTLRQLLVQTRAPGFELVRRVPSPGAQGGVAELAVWRLPAPTPGSEPASMSAR